MTTERNGRTCFECGEWVDWDDEESVWAHIHEIGLPGRLYRAAQKRRKRAVSGPGATNRNSGSDMGGPSRPDDARGASRSEPRDG